MKAIELTSENFESTIQDATAPILVDFHAQWCGPCKMMSPVLDELAEAQDGSAIVAKVDIDAARDIATRYQIKSVPTLIVFQNGKPVLGTRGAQSKATLEDMLRQAGAVETA